MLTDRLLKNVIEAAGAAQNKRTTC